MKKILFVTINNLPTNPRLLKEIKLASKRGYEVSCCLFDFGNHWSSNLNKGIMKELPKVCFYVISATRKPFFQWVYSSLINKLAQIINSKNIAVAAYASNKRTWLLMHYFPRKKYDLIIAHNLGALYPAYYWAKKTKSKYAFDIEDYHPGEVLVSGKDDKEIKRREFLMRTMLPKASYISYASPLIGERSLSLCETIPPHLLINNTFNKSEFVFQECLSPKIEFVWFSQTISYGRGLEIILSVLSKRKYEVHCTIIGNLDRLFYNDVLSKYSDILTIKDPMPQKDLHKEIGKYDIGIAFETAVDLNREVCLTNKILTYTLAGLFIFSTDLPGQKQFLDANKDIGIYTSPKFDDIDTKMSYILENIENIRNTKKMRFEKSNELSWERESKKLKSIWDIILKK